jgi:mannose-6-phosphate isomerase
MQRIYPLEGKVQPYSWGGMEYIAGLLGTGNSEGKPMAEYWLGAHPNYPSTLTLHESSISLFRFIQIDPQNVLGDKVTHEFGSLPYLLKVLDVRQMLSIQVHPDKDSAAVNFKKENAAGIPITAPHRNYKDENHKPELMVALGDFWLLHGFKPMEQLKGVLAATPELAFLLPLLDEGGYEQVFRRVMTMEQEEVNDLGRRLSARILPLYEAGRLGKESEDFWAARAVQTFCKDDHYDKGLFSIYLLNVVYLKKGEGIYQPQGLLHAYLEGQNVEIMANSDNVLRAGLTDKHIDVPELLKHVQFGPTYPDVLKPSGRVETAFTPPVKEFALVRYEAPEEVSRSLHSTGPEILLVLEGEAEVKQEDNVVCLRKGEAAFVEANTDFQLLLKGGTDCFRATIPNV